MGNNVTETLAAPRPVIRAFPLPSPSPTAGIALFPRAVPAHTETRDYVTRLSPRAHFYFVRFFFFFVRPYSSLSPVFSRTESVGCGPAPGAIVVCTRCSSVSRAHRPPTHANNNVVTIILFSSTTTHTVRFVSTVSISFFFRSFSSR